MTQIIASFSEIAGRYDAAFVDLWGCLHNGYEPFAAAVATLEQFRDRGGKIILLTNSPRPRPSVIRQLDKIGVARDLYHDIAASGDASQFSLAAGDVGSKVYHLGPERDLGFFADLPLDILNGREVSTSMAALRDRDVISSAAKASEWIFTTERLPQVTHFEGSEGGYCFRCKRPVVTGQDVVICPNCLAPYHQLETQPCWTYASFCANCNRSTELANTRYAWTPDEL